MNNHVCYEICGDTTYNHNFGDYACQDSNSNNMDGCTSGCLIDEGWYCTGGSTTTSDTCYEICGDSFDLRQLECEDGNTVDYDGCTDCVIDDGYYCVDSTTLVAGFTGYLTAYDPATCYDICGDGLLVDLTMYSCDDGDNDSGDGCSAKC
jgi:cysteine-rich repeat protein